MNIKERAIKGGNALLEKRGRDYFRSIGRKGGRKGGQALLDTFGTDIFVERGHKGGRTTLRRYGKSHYRRMGEWVRHG